MATRTAPTKQPTARSKLSVVSGTETPADGVSVFTCDLSTDRDTILEACIEELEGLTTAVLIALLPVLAKHSEVPSPPVQARRLGLSVHGVRHCQEESA